MKTWLLKLAKETAKGGCPANALDTEITIVTQAGMVMALKDPHNTGHIAGAYRVLLESFGAMLIQSGTMTKEDFDQFKEGDPDWNDSPESATPILWS